LKGYNINARIRQVKLKISKLNHHIIRLIYIELLINFMYIYPQFYYGNILAKWGILRVDFLV
jgi:hypothetical protein